MGKRSASSYRGGGKGRVGGNCSLPAAENSKLPSSRYAFGVTTSRFAQLATRLLSGREPGSRFCLVLASFIVSLERLHRGPSGFELSLSQDLTIQKPKTLDPGSGAYREDDKKLVSQVLKVIWPLFYCFAITSF